MTTSATIQFPSRGRIEAAYRLIAVARILKSHYKRVVKAFSHCDCDSYYPPAYVELVNVILDILGVPPTNVSHRKFDRELAFRAVEIIIDRGRDGNDRKNPKEIMKCLLSDMNEMHNKDYPDPLTENLVSPFANKKNHGELTNK